MKQLFIFLVFSVSCACTIHTSQGKDYSSKEDYSFIKEFAVTTPVTLNVSTAGGNIGVSGTDNAKVEVKFIVKQKNQVLDISADQLDKYADWEMVNDKQSVTIRITKIKVEHTSVSFQIETPHATSANLKTNGGNLAAENLTGQFVANTDGGNMAFEHITGKLDAHTQGGNVALNYIKAPVECSTQGGNLAMENMDGKVNISTMGGNIAGENIAPYLVAKTMGGNVAISGAQGYVEVNTAGGNMAFDNISGSLKAETGGGSISANLRKIENSLTLNTGAGNISVEIPGSIGYNLNLHADRVAVPLSHFEGTKEEGSVDGKVNGGGPLVKISTNSGNLSIEFK